MPQSNAHMGIGMGTQATQAWQPSRGKVLRALGPLLTQFPHLYKHAGPEISSQCTARRQRLAGFAGPAYRFLSPHWRAPPSRVILLADPYLVPLRLQPRGSPATGGS